MFWILFKVSSAILLLGIMGVLFDFPKIQTTEKKLNELNFEKRSQYWSDRIQEVGGQTAYRELSEWIRDFGSGRKHFEVHIFGDSLFRAKGIEGIKTCDGQYNYACFHAFMIRAIEEEGVDAAQEMHTACSDELGPTAEQCQHGIGHGILGTLGYEPEDIEEALTVCDALSPPSTNIGGCAGGVFMEHGMRGMQTEGATEPRPFVLQDVLEPCTSLQNAEYYASCSYWIPMWWMETNPEREDDTSMAKKMGVWCKQMPGGETAYTSCIAGIANRMQLLTNEDPLNTSRMCALITSDPTYQYICQERSAWRFTVYYSLSTALKACEGMDDSRVARCKEEATVATKNRRADQVDQEKYERPAPETDGDISD